MSRSIVIHIGSGKTGSTSIQKNLYHNKSNNDQKIFYPTLLEHKTNQIFRFAFCESNKTPSNIRKKYNKKPQEYKKFQCKIIADFLSKTKGYQHVVLSSEFLFLSTDDEIQVIKAFLEEAGFTKLYIVCYVRNPADYYLSVAQQAMKSKSKIPTPSNFGYEISKTLKRWASIDPTRLIVKEFDRKLLRDNDIVKDFFHILEELGYPLTLNTVRSANESMSVESTMVLQNFHEVLKGSSISDKQADMARLAIRKFSNQSSGGTKPSLKVEIRHWIMGLYEKEMEEISTLYGVFSSLLSNRSTKSHNNPPSVVGFQDVVESYDPLEYLNSYCRLKQLYHNEK